MKRIVIAFFMLFLATESMANDIRNQISVQTGKAELVVVDMQPNRVAELVKDTLSGWAIPAHVNLRVLPNPIPSRPDTPTSVQRYFSGAPVTEFQCPTAYGEVTKRPSTTNNAFVGEVEILQACLYAFQRGVKIYFIYTMAKKSESLTSGLFNGIAKSIRGGDDEWILKQINRNIDALKKNLPSLLVERIELPGQMPLEPDKAAMSGIYTGAPPVATTSVSPVVAGVTRVDTPQNLKIEARKNLTAMGLVYHAQDQFIGAIRRKDDVAVGLFIEAGGIDLSATDKAGKTPADHAHEVGSSEIVALIAGKGPNSQSPSQAAGLQAVTSTTPLPVLPAAATPSSLPPEMMNRINAQVDALNLPAEKKEAYRAQMVRQAEMLFSLGNARGTR